MKRRFCYWNWGFEFDPLPEGGEAVLEFKEDSPTRAVIDFLHPWSGKRNRCWGSKEAFAKPDPGRDPIKGELGIKRERWASEHLKGKALIERQRLQL